MLSLSSQCVRELGAVWKDDIYKLSRLPIGALKFLFLEDTDDWEQLLIGWYMN